MPEQPIKKVSDPFAVLEELSKLGKKEKETEIVGTKITLSTLEANEEAETFIACANLNGTAYFYRMKQETLKYAIKAIDGQRLDDYKKITDESDREKLKQETLEKVAKVLKTWDESLVNYLYTQWAELSKESEDELEAKGIKVIPNELMEAATSEEKSK